MTKKFGDSVAVRDINLSIADGEFFSLLGPSGSGKTTTLRMIAGFENPDQGRVILHDEDVTEVPPFLRDVNTVFQDYALFPHMTVAENVGYGLMVRKTPPNEKSTRVAEALEMVHLERFAQRKPAQLSGGQRQRVALARALINRPSVLLLDEPLGALDLKLRQAMQVELKTLQKEVGITFVYVTHDQEEALTMSDRMAVFNDGSIEQVGSPGEVYENPLNSFVAGFVGTSNVFTAEVAAKLTGRPETFTVRPEKISLNGHHDGWVTTPGTVEDIQYLGMFSRYRVDLGDMHVEVISQNIGHDSEMPRVGESVNLSWAEDSCKPLRISPSSAGASEVASDAADAGNEA